MNIRMVGRMAICTERRLDGRMAGVTESKVDGSMDTGGSTCQCCCFKKWTSKQ